MSLGNILIGAGAGAASLIITPTPVITIQTTGSHVTIPKAVGTADGNLLIGAIGNNGSKPWTPAIGFTELYDNFGFELSDRIAASEPSTYDFARAGGKDFASVGTILRIPGGSFDSIGSADGSSNNPAPGSITMSGNGLLLAFFFSSTPGSTFTVPTGMSLVASNSAQFSMAIFKENVSAGATGSRTSSMSKKGYGILMGVI